MKTYLLKIRTCIRILHLLKPTLWKRGLLAMGVSLILTIGTMALILNSQKEPGKDALAKEDSKSISDSFIYKTITPKKRQEDSKPILLGRVISNEIANVYPRRNGIVEDIFFDIGDRIKKGDVMATLLPPGVDGEDKAIIAEKKAMLGKASSLLYQSRKVASSSIEQEKIRLQEKKIALQKAKDTQQSLVSKAETIAKTTDLEGKAKIESQQQEIKVIEASINLLKDQLTTSTQLEEDRKERKKGDTSQSLEQLKTTFVNIEQVIEHVLLGNNERANYKYLNESDVEDNIGIYNRPLLSALVNNYNSFLLKKSEFISSPSEEEMKRLVSNLISQAEEVLQQTQTVLSSSASELFSNNNTTSHGDLTRLIENVNKSQSRLLKAKEKYEDSLNDYQITESSGSEKLSMLKNQILQKQELLKLSQKKLKLSIRQQQKQVKGARRDVAKSKAMERSDIELLEAQIQIAKEKVQLTQAQQNKMIASEASSWAVASAQLQKALSKNGNIEIKSPFSGVISKRSLSVGEMVVMNMPVFELIDVQTSLAKKAKREIQFQVPEEINSEVQVGTQISFTLLEDDGKEYSATISRKSPQVDSESHTITLQAKLDDDLQFAHNLSVRVLLNGYEDKSVQIPSSAIKRSNQSNYVWVLNRDKEPEKLRISIVEDDGEFAEVTGRISSETQVILDSPDLFLQEKDIKEED